MRKPFSKDEDVRSRIGLELLSLFEDYGKKGWDTEVTAGKIQTIWGILEPYMADIEDLQKKYGVIG